MSLKIIFAGLSLAVLAACGGSADIESAPGSEKKDESVFSGYLSAVDKAKAAQQATNDRQRQLDASLGFEGPFAQGRSDEGPHTLGMTAPASANATAPGEESVFDGAVTSMNKARATRDMLDNRQRQMDAMWGVEPQSTAGTDDSVEGRPNGERPAAEDEMLTIVDRARQARKSANERERNLEATWGVESQSAR